MIYHIADSKEWMRAQAEGSYSCESLSREGFIHCSDHGQVSRVANFLFKGRRDLVLLEIDPLLLDAELKYEGETEELFPHVYGSILLSAIVAVHKFQPEPDGTFVMPTT